MTNAPMQSFIHNSIITTDKEEHEGAAVERLAIKKNITHPSVEHKLNILFRLSGTTSLNTHLGLHNGSFETNCQGPFGNIHKIPRVNKKLKDKIHLIMK